MTDIASSVERIIEKLDGMTTEVVPKMYGTDIASKVEHIAKQLDYVQAGGGSDVSIMFVNLDNSSGEQTTYKGEPATSYLCDKTPSQIFNHLQNGGVAYFRSHIINDSIYLFLINDVEYYIEDNNNYYRFKGTKTEVGSSSATIVQAVLEYNSEFSEERVVWYTESNRNH